MVPNYITFPSSIQIPPGFANNSSTSSPRGELSAAGEYSERLNHSNNVCNALQTQVNNLQGDRRSFLTALYPLLLFYSQSLSKLLHYCISSFSILCFVVQNISAVKCDVC